MVWDPELNHQTYILRKLDFLQIDFHMIDYYTRMDLTFFETEGALCQKMI